MSWHFFQIKNLSRKSCWQLSMLAAVNWVRIRVWICNGKYSPKQPNLWEKDGAMLRKVCTMWVMFVCGKGQRHLLKACGSSCPLLVPRLSLLVHFFVGLSVVAGQQWGPPESQHLAEWWQNCQCLLQKFDLCLGTFVRDRNPNMCHPAGQIHCNIGPQKDIPFLLWGGKASQAEKWILQNKENWKKGNLLWVLLQRKEFKNTSLNYSE